MAALIGFFVGFNPAKSMEQRARLLRLQGEPATVWIRYNGPRRLGFYIQTITTPLILSSLVVLGVTMSWPAGESSLFELQLRETKAQDYDKEYLSLHGADFLRAELGVIRRALDLKQEDVLLDLGCGTGRITVALASSCRHIFAVDRSERSLAVLTERAAERGLSNVTIIHADTRYELPVDVPITKVLCVQLLQHLPRPEDRDSTLSLAAKRLSRGGRCVVINEMFGIPRKIRGKPKENAGVDTLYFLTFTPHEMRDMMRVAGFKPIRLMGCGLFYWTRYRLATHALVRLEEWASLVPGASWFAKFGAAVAIKA